MTFDVISLSAGFAAAALAVASIHQTMVFLFNRAGWIATKPWSVEPFGPLRVPAIVNGLFWGGLWGAVYALAEPLLPGSAAWIKGWAFGAAMALGSNFTLLPMIKGQPLFMGLDPKKIVAVLVILSCFGAATATFYDVLRGAA